MQPASVKKTLLRRRRPLGRAAWKTPNRGEDRSFSCWIAKQRLEQKECFFTDTAVMNWTKTKEPKNEGPKRDRKGTKDQRGTEKEPKRGPKGDRKGDGRGPAGGPKRGQKGTKGGPKLLGRGDDTVGNPHRAQTYPLEPSELILLLKLDKRLPAEQFEATASQSTIPSPPLTTTTTTTTTTNNNNDSDNNDNNNK